MNLREIVEYRKQPQAGCKLHKPTYMTFSEDWTTLAGNSNCQGILGRFTIKAEHKRQIILRSNGSQRIIQFTRQYIRESLYMLKFIEL